MLFLNKVAFALKFLKYILKKYGVFVDWSHRAEGRVQ
jgi:hypothetical protein